MEKKIPGILILAGVLIICIHLGSSTDLFPELDIDIQLNLKVSTQTDQAADS